MVARSHYCSRCGHTEGCVGHTPVISRNDVDRNKCSNCAECNDPILAVARMRRRLLQLSKK